MHNLENARDRMARFLIAYRSIAEWENHFEKKAGELFCFIDYDLMDFLEELEEAHLEGSMLVKLMNERADVDSKVLEIKLMDFFQSHELDDLHHCNKDYEDVFQDMIPRENRVSVWFVKRALESVAQRLKGHILSHPDYKALV